MKKKPEDEKMEKVMKPGHKKEMPKKKKKK